MNYLKTNILGLNLVMSLLLAACLSQGTILYGQDAIQTETNLSKLSWKKVATGMPVSWYASPEAVQVAENLLLFQKDIGGWEKNIPYHHLLSEAQKAAVINNKAKSGATIDNGATVTELHFLSRVYKQTKEERYAKAFENGCNYLLEAQYPNGGYPQFYPLKKGYATHITYNDNAMVNVLVLLKDLSEEKTFAHMPLNENLKEKAKLAFNKGVDCILNTQIKVKGVRTVWCAQHDEVTLLPANARSYELASFSGAESIGIVNLLMGINNPSREVVDAVKGAMTWLDQHKITGIAIKDVADKDGKKNKVVIPDMNAQPLLARFYDLQTAKPFFCDRDGVKKNKLEELDAERRNGYSWYSGGFEQLKEKYREWLKKWGEKE